MPALSGYDGTLNVRNVGYRQWRDFGIAEQKGYIESRQTAIAAALYDPFDGLVERGVKVLERDPPFRDYNLQMTGSSFLMVH
jgi:hypothetical protein